jgi:hypothetical protein
MLGFAPTGLAFWVLGSSGVTHIILGIGAFALTVLNTVFRSVSYNFGPPPPPPLSLSLSFSPPPS